MRKTAVPASMAYFPNSARATNGICVGYIITKTQ